jgi:hypothetical protein
MKVSLFFENFPIPAIKFVIGQVGIALCHCNVLVACKVLGKLKVFGNRKNTGYKIVPERVGGYRSNSIVAKYFTHTLRDNITASSGCNGFNLGTSALIMPGEKGQGAQGLSGFSI